MSRTVLRLLALVLLLWPGSAAAQLLLPTPELRSQRDCATCPELVLLPDGLHLSRSAVTLGEFRAFAEATGYVNNGWGCKWFHPGFPQTDRHPVTCITHQAATRYVDWLSGVTGQRYRLPTADEMTYAVMGFETGNYWWGPSIGRNRANCVACGSPFDGQGTTPVDTFPPNPFNLLDAVGNVWVWTSDCTTASCEQRVLVGGAWSSPPSDLRIAKRISNAADVPFNTYGLRVVREEEAE